MASDRRKPDENIDANNAHLPLIGERLAKDAMPSRSVSQRCRPCWRSVLYCHVPAMRRCPSSTRLRQPALLRLRRRKARWRHAVDALQTRAAPSCDQLLTRPPLTCIVKRRRRRLFVAPVLFLRRLTSIHTIMARRRGLRNDQTRPLGRFYTGPPLLYHYRRYCCDSFALLTRRVNAWYFSASHLYFQNKIFYLLVNKLILINFSLILGSINHKNIFVYRLTCSFIRCTS